MSVPSGKKFNLKELKNKDYLILLKFLNGDNFKGFYETLDKLIIKSIPSFNELDLCDKLYIYLTYYYYSVNNSFLMKDTSYNDIEIDISVLLNELETKYDKELSSIKFHNWNAFAHYPKNILFDDYNIISIDYLSSLKKIENVEITLENIKDIRDFIDTKSLNEIEYEISKKFSFEIVFFSLKERKISEWLLTPNIFYAVAYIYKDLLENFYMLQYILTHYIKIEWSSVLEMTPLETTILYKNFVEDKEKQTADEAISEATSNLYF